MKSVLNQLIELQELNFAKEEQIAASSKMPLEQLEKAVANIRRNCRAVADRYDCRNGSRGGGALRTRNCSRCAGGTAQVVNAAKAASNCRTVHTVAGLISRDRGVSRKRRTTETSAEVGIARFSAANLMVPSCGFDA
jgi:hypothetical protein